MDDALSGVDSLYTVLTNVTQVVIQPATTQLHTCKHLLGHPVLTFRLRSSSAYFSAFLIMFSMSSLLSPPDDWITTVGRREGVDMLFSILEIKQHLQQKGETHFVVLALSLCP